MKHIFVVTILLFLTNIALAQDETPPVLSEPFPEDGSYALGGDKTFSINITEENLDQSTAKLHIKSIDSADWDTYSLSCTIRGGLWYCTATVSLDIVGSDTVEQFYFEANDTYDNYGNYGSESSPLLTTIDINPPEISFLNPENGTWVSSTETIQLDVNDISSGVDETTIQYSFDNSNWQSVDSEYQATWDTTSRADGSTVTIYARASDVLGNTGTAQASVRVDNGNPVTTIVTPTASQTLSGIVNVEINTEDAYSGINNAQVKYEIQSTERTMDCVASGNGYTCDEYLDTTQFSDGNYTLNFYVYDNAGNLDQSSVSIIVDNTRSSISITNINNNGYVKDVVTVYAKVTNPSEAVTGVDFKWRSSSSSGDWESMDCDSNYECSATWDTTSLSEGQYTLTVNATGTMDYLVSHQITVTVDNTDPVLSIQQPTGTYVSGVFHPKVIVTDTYQVNPMTVKFEIEESGTGVNDMNCLMQTQGKKYICTGNYNSSLIDDGTYTLTFTASDWAGNSNSTSKAIIINNLNAPTTTSSQENSESTSGGTSSGTGSGSEEKTSVIEKITNVKEVINKIIQKIITEKYLLVSIAVLASIGFSLFYLLRKPKEQKIEMEENEIQ